MTAVEKGTGNYGRGLAKAAMEIGAIRLRPEEPFTWASGYRMPIYNDNRLFLWYPEHRRMIVEGLAAKLGESGLAVDVVAGIPSAGIPWGMGLAERLGKPFIYVRKEVKDHGKKKSVEGLDDLEVLKGCKVIVVEDLVSTGKSSMESIVQLLELGAEVPACLSIFSYGFPEARRHFEERGVAAMSLLDFPGLLRILKEDGYFTVEQIDMLSSWNAAPFAWGEEHGFPKI